MINRYVIEIFYSDEGEGFIAVVPELPGCSAFGETAALVEVGTAIALRLEKARAKGCPIPEPAGRAPVRS